MQQNTKGEEDLTVLCRPRRYPRREYPLCGWAEGKMFSVLGAGLDGAMGGVQLEDQFWCQVR